MFSPCAKAVLALVLLFGSASTADAVGHRHGVYQTEPVPQSIAGRTIDCAMVRWAVKTFPRALLKNYIKQATPEQLRMGRRCLRGQ